MTSSRAGRFRLLLTGGLIALLALCLAVFWNTREAMSQLPLSRNNTVVDLRPWQTVEGLAALAESAEESEYAREAEHDADHEVDQAFAAAIRQATLRRPTLTGEAIDLSRKVERLKQTVSADQAHVRELTAQDPDDDLDIAKAQLGLDTDELTEAQQDLARAGGDERGRIQQELAAHEATMHNYDRQAGKETTRAVAASRAHSTVAAALDAWWKERTRRELLQAASAGASADAAALTAKHDQLESKVQTAPTPTGKAERLAHLSTQSTRSQLLGIYDDRIATERQLAKVYDHSAQSQVERTNHSGESRHANGPVDVPALLTRSARRTREPESPA